MCRHVQQATHTLTCATHVHYLLFLCVLWYSLFRVFFRDGVSCQIHLTIHSFSSSSYSLVFAAVNKYTDWLRSNTYCSTIDDIRCHHLTIIWAATARYWYVHTSNSSKQQATCCPSTRHVAFNMLLGHAVIVWTDPYTTHTVQQWQCEPREWYKLIQSVFRVVASNQ